MPSDGDKNQADNVFTSAMETDKSDTMAVDNIVNQTKKVPSKSSSAIKKKKQKKPKRLDARERRRLKIYDIPPEAMKYALFEPLHQLWLGYMEELYRQSPQIPAFAQKLLKADFHGALLTVAKCTDPAYVGMSGIMFQETLSVFKIITKADKVKVLPKNCSVFTLQLDICDTVFTLYGSQFVGRAADRAAKKFKSKPSIELL